MDIDALANLPLFADMAAHEIEEALSKAERIDVKSGEYIITQDETQQNLWFIKSGQCEVIRHTSAGCQIKLAELGPSMQLGEMSFFHAAPNSADVIAQTDMELLRLSRSDYDHLCATKNPIAFKLAINSLEQLSERLRKTDQWITNLVCNENHTPTPSEWTSFREIIFR